MIIKVRKIPLFILLTLLLSSPIAITPPAVNAEQTQDCNLSHVNDDPNTGPLVSIQYEPATENLAGKNSFTVTINGAQRLNTGGYNLIVYGMVDLGPPPGRSYYQTTNINQGDRSISFTVNTYDNGFGLPVLHGNDWFNVELYRASDDAPICTDYITIPPGPGDSGGPPAVDKCTLTLGGQPWRPQGTKVTIKANDLDKDKYPDGQKLGFVVRNLRTNQDKNTCVTAGDLRSSEGIVLDSARGWSFIEGTYSVSVGNNFEFFGNCTMDGNPKSKICNSADDFYKVNVSAVGGWQYFDCTTKAADRAGGKFEDWDQSEKLQWCNLKTLPGPRARHGLAPYCITDPYSPTPKGVCSDTPGVGIACPDKKCDTAIGSFSYSYTPEGFAKSVLRLFLSISGGIVLLFLILNGYRLMTSQGDPEKIKEARESIVSAIAGLLLIIFSLVILQFITVNVLGIPGFGP